MTATSRGSTKPAVVILNMHYSGLGIARNLHGLGIEVHGLGPRLFGSTSRHCSYRQCPDSGSEARACAEFLVEFARRFPVPPILLATRDHDVQLIMDHRAALDRHYLIPAPPPEVLAAINDKPRLYEVARELGIPYPGLVVIDSAADLDVARSQLRYPCIAKPDIASRWRKPGIWDAVGRRKAVVVENHAELEAFYGVVASWDPRLTVQDFVPGDDTQLAVFGSYYNPESELLRYFTGRKLLQYPAGSGTGVAVRALPVPEIVEASVALLRRLHYRGVSEIEYKFDPRSGQHLLIEINPRHWDQHPLGAACGVNLSRLLYQDLAAGGAPEAIQRAQPVNWIAEDSLVFSFLSNLRRHDQPWSRYLDALRAPRCLAATSIHDLRPAIELARGTAAILLGAVWSRLRRALGGHEENGPS